jgi:tetratricopeptide (TPR) repeat protein
MPSKTLAILLLCAVLPACGSSQHAAPGARSGSAVANQASEAEDLARRGREAAAAGDAVRAEQYLALAIEKGAKGADLLPTLLRVCLSSSHLRAALNHAQPFLARHPDDDQLRYLVASIHLSLGQHDEAKATLELLLLRKPEHPDAHYLLGVVEAESNVDSAREHFRAYLEHAPNGRHAPEVRSRLSELLIRERQATSAPAEQALLAERGPREPAPAAPSSGNWLDFRAPRVATPTTSGRSE